MFPCPYCRAFTFSLLQGAVGPEQLQCRYCESSVARALFAKPVGLMLLLMVALLSLATSISSHTPVPLVGLVLALVVGRAYWPSSERAQLLRTWVLVSVTVVALAWLDGVL
jgi:hypothetical protein